MDSLVIIHFIIYDLALGALAGVVYFFTMMNRKTK